MLTVNLRSGIRRARGAAARRLAPGPTPEQAPRDGVAGQRLEGMVERFSRRMVIGWISVPPDTPPVAVTLQVNRLTVASTYSTPWVEPAPETDDETTPPEVGVGEPAPEAPPAAKQPPVKAEDLPSIPSPADGSRNSRQQVRTFSFRLRDVWKFVNRSTRITVRVDGVPLPIAGHGMFLRPRRRGADTVPELREKLADGHLFSQFGRLQLSKQLDTTWQKVVMDLYARTAAVLETRFGIETFFIYGTLLGAVREGGYIGHDVDFDAGYLSRHTDPEATAQELTEIALALIEEGLSVTCKHTALHIHGPLDPDIRIDLFHAYFDQDDRLQLPFGIAGTSELTRADWSGTRTIDFPGGAGLVPANGEALVEHLYGPDWRSPKPGFNWELDRTRQAPAASRTTPAQRAQVYWADFYAHHAYTDGSTFFDVVSSRADTPGTVIDIGCGDGRDSCAFGASGRTVTGLDQSQVGIEHATRQAQARGLADQVRFTTCDVAEVDLLEGMLRAALTDAGGEPVLFYLRFFLHSIPADVQDGLMRVIDRVVRPGDQLAAEFRTVDDEARDKVHGRHYRRFQSGPEYGAGLVADGFELLHEEEGTGLSVYQGEDPVLYRVVARRR